MNGCRTRWSTRVPSTSVPGYDLSKPLPIVALRDRMGFRIGEHTLMDNGLGTALATLPPTKKAGARVAMVQLENPALAVLSECFRQFGIETVALGTEAVERLRQEKFEACVLRLGDQSKVVMEAARTSASNSRMVIYGIGGSAQEAMRYSKYCINAVFHEPVERQAALKLVRATQMLVVHEFRRYVRIPVMTEVALVMADGTTINTTSQEISSGGMSLKSPHQLEPGQLVEVSFALLTLPRVWVRAYVTWRGKNKSFGLKFDPTDERRARLKEWIDAYLES